MKDRFGAKDSVFFDLYAHWSFASDHRCRVFDARAIDVLRGIFADACLHTQATRVEMDGEDGANAKACRGSQRLRFRLTKAEHPQHRPPTHRATEDTGLSFTTASLSALSFPDLK